MSWSAEYTFSSDCGGETIIFIDKDDIENESKFEPNKIVSKLLVTLKPGEYYYIDCYRYFAFGNVEKLYDGGKEQLLDLREERSGYDVKFFHLS